MSTRLDRLLQTRPRTSGEAKRATKSGASKVEQGAQRVRTSRTFRGVARVGLLARAVVYLVVGALILEIAAKGRASSGPNSVGAFAEIARQPAGTEVLVLLAIGLAAYAIWRFVEAVSRLPQGQRASVWTRIGFVAVGVLYVALCVDVVKVITGSRPSEGPEQHPSSIAASVLRLPLGPELLGLVAAAVLAGGIALIIWGAVHDYGKTLQTAQMKRRLFGLSRWSGIIGNAARGIAVVLVASSIFVSAISTNPEQAKSLDVALEGLAATPAGTVLLIVVGAGFLSFAVHSTLEARFRRV